MCKLDFVHASWPLRYCLSRWFIIWTDTFDLLPFASLWLTFGRHLLQSISLSSWHLRKDASHFSTCSGIKRRWGVMSQCTRGFWELSSWCRYTCHRRRRDALPVGFVSFLHPGPKGMVHIFTHLKSTDVVNHRELLGWCLWPVEDPGILLAVWTLNSWHRILKQLLIGYTTVLIHLISNSLLGRKR